MTADHSPGPRRVRRIRRTRCQPGTPQQPLLLIVYDSPSGAGNKAGCPPVFELNAGARRRAARDEPRQVLQNVRSEGEPRGDAAVGALDALAFTRSLGDLHLQSAAQLPPEIFELDLDALLPPIEQRSGAAAAAAAGRHHPRLHRRHLGQLEVRRLHKIRMVPVRRESSRVCE